MVNPILSAKLYHLIFVKGEVFPSKEPFSNNEHLILGAILSQCRFSCRRQTSQTIFPMAYEAKRGRLTFSVYVIKRLTQKLIKNGKRKEVGI